jgi:geranylgeranylglycerol-phosphate geranylgeranyltransferase
MIQKWIERIENSQISYPSLLIGVLCIIMLRNFIEPLAIGQGAYPFGTHIIFSAWYLNVFLSVSLFLSWVAKVDIRKVLKVVGFGSLIILLPPLIDFVFATLTSRTLLYIYLAVNPSFFPQYFLTLGGDFTQAGFAQVMQNSCFGIDMCGITPGIRVELFIVSLFGLFFAKRAGIKRGVAAALGVYTIASLWGSIPTFISSSAVPEALLRVPTSLNESGFFGNFSLTMYTLLLTLQFFALFRKISTEKLNACLRNTRPLRTALALSLVGLGVGFATSVDPMLTLAVCASVFLSVQWGIAVNDLSDIPIDKALKKKRPLALGILSESEAKTLAFSLFALSVLTALVDEFILILILLADALFFIYSAPPFRLKRFPFSTIITAFVGVLFFSCGFYANDFFGSYPLNIALVLLAGFTLSFNAKDLQDFEGDKKEGIKTLPVIFGLDKAKKIIAGLFVVSYAVMPILVPIRTMLLAPLLGLASAYIILKRDARESELFLMYFISIALLMAGMWRG